MLTPEHRPTAAFQNRPNQNANDCESLIDWYIDRFVLDWQRAPALMNPCGAKAKYSRSKKRLTRQMIVEGLSGKPRRLPINGRWQEFPLSIALVPTSNDYARFAVVEIDHGGVAAVRSVLDRCAQHGLWAFGQLGTSDKHDGGHVYIPVVKDAPASLLQHLALLIQVASQVKGEAFPNGACDLRLPVMIHLRAPGGPRRFPLLLQDGTTIDATDAWLAIQQLRSVWCSNLLEQITTAMNELPAPRPAKTQHLHKSKVNPKSCDSVIKWFNANHTIKELLSTVGLKASARTNVVICPFHDDRSPSLVLWTHNATGRVVCRCLSAQSSCKAADVPYLDAFNIYCLIEGIEATTAVARLNEEYGFGHRRELRVDRVAAWERPTPEGVRAHNLVVEQKREELRQALAYAATLRGAVTSIRATPGLGKSAISAQLAQQLHDEGKRIAIVVPNHALAGAEWIPRLSNAFVWQSRASVCTCVDRTYLAVAAQLGYAVRPCKPSCPYAAQIDQCRDKIVIYQHNHLYLQDGARLQDVDVVIVDESPLNVMLQERVVDQEDLRALREQIKEGEQNDPALPVVRALLKLTQQEKTLCLRGPALRDAVFAALGDHALGIVLAAQQSPFAKLSSLAPTRDLLHTPPLVLGKLLIELVRLLQYSNQNNSLALGRAQDRRRAWTWYERRMLLKDALATGNAPAVLILDGSADPYINAPLYAPWPVRLVSIDAPLSPTVEVIQCGVTASTRKIVQERAQLERLVRTVAGVCGELGIVLDGGVSYLDAASYLTKQLGGAWLHYGGQRGQNALKDARALAIIASPTASPDVVISKALALWADDPPLDSTFEKVGRAEYRAKDSRLQAMNALHGAEELRQAAHRCRPILSEQTTRLIIFSPWDVTSLGLSPHQIIHEVPHGNSASLANGVAAYQQLREGVQI